MSGLSRFAAASLAAAVCAGCAGDPGAADTPTCNARPVDPAGYEPVETELVEGDTRNGRRYVYAGPNGERVTFSFGVTTSDGADLPKAGRLPLATLGAGQLLGQGTTWALVWQDQFPCDRMRVAGTGISKQAFIEVLSRAQVTAFEEEEEAEGGVAPGGGAIEEEEELEGEIEGVPTGPALEFVGVLDTALEPGGLRPTPPRLERMAGANAWSGGVHCWKGLAQRLGVARDDWMVAVVGRTSNELDFVLDRIGREPIFYGQLRARCD